MQSMQLVKGVWLPPLEFDLLSFAKSEDWRYQGHKLDAAMKYVKRFDVAVDVGAHCGLWSKELVKQFARVIAFEPIKIHRECFVKNVQGNYQLFPFALGEEESTKPIAWKAHKTGCSHIDVEGGMTVRIKRLDDLYQGPCDFLKIDTEGYEEFVLRGATDLLKHRPVIIVEQKPNNAQRYGLQETGAVEYLKNLGAKQREVISGDYIMSWDE